MVAVDQGSELRDALQVGSIAVTRQEQLAASLHDAVALARPDRLHAIDVLHAEDDRDAVSSDRGPWNVEASFAISKRDVSARPLPCWWSWVVRGWASCCGHGCLAPVRR